MTNQYFASILPRSFPGFPNGFQSILDHLGKVDLVVSPGSDGAEEWYCARSQAWVLVLAPYVRNHMIVQSNLNTELYFLSVRLWKSVETLEEILVKM